MKEELSIRQFNIHEASWPTEGNILSNIRRLVFVVEQKLDGQGESDSRDEESWHWLATDREDVAIGTVRLLPDGQIGKLAVLEKFRGKGAGTALLEQAVEKAKHLGLPDVSVVVQANTLKFYERMGFSTSGKALEDASVNYQRMVQHLAPLDDNVQRLTASELDPGIAVKEFDTREVTFQDVAKIIKNIR